MKHALKRLFQVFSVIFTPRKEAVGKGPVGVFFGEKQRNWRIRKDFVWNGFG